MLAQSGTTAEEIAETVVSQTTMAAEMIVDKLSSYFDTDQVKNDSLYAPLAMEEGEVCGIGVHLSLVHDPPILLEEHVSGTTVTYINIVQSVERNSAAEAAGLQTGDILVGVNGTRFEYGQQIYLPDELAEMIRGPQGSEAELLVERGDRLLKFAVKRKPTPPSTASPGAVPVTPEQRKVAPDVEGIFRGQIPSFPSTSFLDW